jgi:hypothetical protein
VTTRTDSLIGLFGGVADRTLPGMTNAAKAVLADPAPSEVEIRSRVDAIDAGAMEFEPWDAVKQRIEKEILVVESRNSTPRNQPLGSWPPRLARMRIWTGAQRAQAGCATGWTDGLI